VSRRRDPEAFEHELRAATRSLASEPLPDGILDPGVNLPGPAVRTRAWPAVVAAAVLVIGVAGLLRLTSAPNGVGHLRPFRDASSIGLELRGSGYVCGVSTAATTRPAAATPIASGALEVADFVCTTPGTLHPAVGALILSRDGSGAVRRAHIKAGILGTALGTAESTRDSILNRLIGIVFADSAAGAQARAFLVDRMPLPSGGHAGTTIEGIAVSLDRDVSGGYSIDLGEVSGPS
jgi:hypothetical protein